MQNFIYYTLREYMQKYNDEFALFKSKFNGADEDDFIKEQIKIYQICMNNTSIVKRKDGTDFSVLSVYNGSKQIKQILEKFMDSRGTWFDTEKCTEMYYEFRNIKKYLEHKLSIKTSKLSANSFALYVYIRQELGLLQKFPYGDKSKLFQKICEEEHQNFSTAFPHYSKITSYKTKNPDKGYSDKHVKDLYNYFKNEKELNYLNSLLVNKYE